MKLTEKKICFARNFYGYGNYLGKKSKQISIEIMALAILLLHRIFIREKKIS